MHPASGPPTPVSAELVAGTTFGGKLVATVAISPTTTSSHKSRSSSPANKIPPTTPASGQRSVMVKQEPAVKSVGLPPGAAVPSSAAADSAVDPAGLPPQPDTGSAEHAPFEDDNVPEGLYEELQPPRNPTPAEARAGGGPTRRVSGNKLAKAQAPRPKRKARSPGFAQQVGTFGAPPERPFTFPPKDPRGGMDPWAFALAATTPLITPNSNGILPDFNRKDHVVKAEKDRWNERHPFNLVYEGPPDQDGWKRVRVWIGSRDCLRNPQALWNNGIAVIQECTDYVQIDRYDKRFSSFTLMRPIDINAFMMGTHDPAFLLDQLRDLDEAAETAAASGLGVMFLCLQGANRSPTVTAIYLAIKTAFGLDEVFHQMSQMRPICDIFGNFFAQFAGCYSLKEYWRNYGQAFVRDWGKEGRQYGGLNFVCDSRREAQDYLAALSSWQAAQVRTASGLDSLRERGLLNEDQPHGSEDEDPDDLLVRMPTPRSAQRQRDREEFAQDQGRVQRIQDGKWSRRFAAGTGSAARTGSARHRQESRGGGRGRGRGRGGGSGSRLASPAEPEQETFGGAAKAAPPRPALQTAGAHPGSAAPRSGSAQKLLNEQQGRGSSRRPGSGSNRGRNSSRGRGGDGGHRGTSGGRRGYSPTREARGRDVRACSPGRSGRKPATSIGTRTKELARMGATGSTAASSQMPAVSSQTREFSPQNAAREWARANRANEQEVDSNVAQAKEAFLSQTALREEEDQLWEEEERIIDTGSAAARDMALLRRENRELKQKLDDERSAADLQHQGVVFVTLCLSENFREAGPLLDKIAASSPGQKPLFCMARDGSGITPLHAAARAQWPFAVEILLGLCPEVADWRTYRRGTPRSWTPLLMACDVAWPRPPDGETNHEQQMILRDVALMLVRQMSPDALCAVTGSHSNFAHVLASRGYEKALLPVLAEFLRVDPESGTSLLQPADVAALLNDINAKKHTVLDLAANCCRSTAKELSKAWPEAEKNTTKARGGGGGASHHAMQRRITQPVGPPPSNNASGDQRRWNRSGR